MAHSHSFEQDPHDIDWRMANTDSLHLWHPTFKDYAQDSFNFLKKFVRVATNYKKALLLHCGDEPTEDLLCHLNEEYVTWMANQMDSIVKQVWNSPLGTPRPFPQRLRLSNHRPGCFYHRRKKSV